MGFFRRVGGLLVVVASALLAGCAGQQGAAPASPTASLLGGPLVAPARAPGATGVPERLTVHRAATPAGARVGPLWRIRSASAGASRVEITWYDRPSARCGAATDVWVNESADRVVIDLTGHGVQPDVVCAALLAPRRMTVPLAEPLGSRGLREHRPSARTGGA